ncbi:MAG TPA: energy transducer TonB [Bacteroidia bacterium]|jgi:TonB family protein|nr:energy transducer TonB [Bacteroidia bacterium]
MNKIFLSLFLFNCSGLFAQAVSGLTPVTDTLYFGKDWKRSVKEEAVYYRIISKQDDHYLLVNRYISNNNPQLIAVSTTIDPPTKNGKAIYFSEAGELQSEGSFVNDKESGPWKFYFENTKISSKGNYVNGEADGEWVLFEKDGKDSNVVNISGRMYKNIHISSQSKSVNDQYNVSYPISEPAQFPGGEEAMGKFVNDNIKYPETESNIEGISYVSFVVETDGSLSAVRIKRGIPNGPAYDQEAMRLVNAMPKWKPGRMYGTAVRVQFTLPIRFTL